MYALQQVCVAMCVCVYAYACISVCTYVDSRLLKPVYVCMHAVYVCMYIVQVQVLLNDRVTDGK